MLPVILLGGIYSGIVTPTEAAAVAAAYALILAVFWYRTMGLRKLIEIFIQSSRARRPLSPSPSPARCS